MDRLVKRSILRFNSIFKGNCGDKVKGAKKKNQKQVTHWQSHNGSAPSDIFKQAPWVIF